MNIAFLTLNILKSIFKVINHGMETYEDNSEFGIYTGDWCSDYYKIAIYAPTASGWSTLRRYFGQSCFKISSKCSQLIRAEF